MITHSFLKLWFLILITPVVYATVGVLKIIGLFSKSLAWSLELKIVGLYDLLHIDEVAE